LIDINVNKPQGKKIVPVAMQLFRQVMYMYENCYSVYFDECSSDNNSTQNQECNFLNKNHIIIGTLKPEFIYSEDRQFRNLKSKYAKVK
jgi:hypothetical protein